MGVLNLIPGKVWFYGVIVVVLLGFGIHYKHLENQVREAKTVAAAAQADVKKVDATAQSTETQSAIIFKQATTIPAIGDIGVECVRKRAGGSPLPAPDAKSGATTGSPADDSGVRSAFDPSGAILTRAHEADAQIAYLQRRVKELETQMNNSP